MGSIRRGLTLEAWCNAAPALTASTGSDTFCCKRLQEGVQVHERRPRHAARLDRRRPHGSGPGHATASKPVTTSASTTARGRRRSRSPSSGRRSSTRRPIWRTGTSCSRWSPARRTCEEVVGGAEGLLSRPDAAPRVIVDSTTIVPGGGGSDPRGRAGARHGDAGRTGQRQSEGRRERAADDRGIGPARCVAAGTALPRAARRAVSPTSARVSARGS